MSTHTLLLLVLLRGWESCTSGLRSDQTERVARETVNWTVDVSTFPAIQLRLD
jgi:hypothetical protein